MGLICVASLKGAPGATTAALALAAYWPEGPAPVVVEADPAGGDIAARWRLHWRPGLADVAGEALASTGPGPEALEAGIQAISVAGAAIGVVCAAPGGNGVRTALPVLCAPESKVLAPADGWVIADLGRLDADSPAWALALAADATLLVVEGALPAVGHLRARIAEVDRCRAAGARFAVVVAPGEYGADQVADALLAADLGLSVAGPAGPAGPVGPDPLTWRGRRAGRAWRDLAAAVSRIADAAPMRALTAGPADVSEADR